LAGRRFFACVLAVLLIIGLAYPVFGEQTKRFQSQVYPLEFDYPADWILEGGAKSYLITLYNPEALEYRDQTNDLISGLKIEIYFNEADEEIQGLIQRSGYKYFPDDFVYIAEDKDCIYLLTWMKVGGKNLLILGYIPEKNKRELYYKLYRKFTGCIMVLPPEDEDETVIV